MKTSLSQYPELESALRAGKLTYLFGSGISGALSNAPCGWGRWLRDGIGELSDGDLAKALEGQLDAANTTNALIAVAGKIIEAAKSDGCYETWMRSSLGSPTLKNELLSATLRKMLLAGDIFATTNYDLLLEAATGLGTLTYSDTGEVFSMLEAGKSTAVLHLHGVYDVVSGLDNIIADTAQYKKIVENLGAQFIQNLLGTRTLVLVGCGQTAEDPNIAQFLTFAQEKLKLKRTYFFLCKEGQIPTGLPKNVIPVVYGTEHSDLQPFLEDMAQLRLRALMDANPLIGRTAQSVEALTSHPLFRYHYAQQTLPFRGRTAELDALNKFLEGGSFAWWAITGQAGAGKSRLALELLMRLGPGWFGFFVSDRAIVRDAETFTPFADTLVVIDYVSGREQTIASILQTLHTVFAKTSYRLRVLLLEREFGREDGTWFAILRQRMGRYNTAEFLSAEHGDGQFLYLEDLDERAVESLIGDVCALHGLSSDEKRDSMLREAYAEKYESLRFRPLFVQLFVEAWIENDCTIPRYDRFDNLLQALLQREQARWLDTFEGDQACCNAMIRLLVRASVSGRLPITEMPELYREDWALVEAFLRKHSFPGHQQQERRSALLRDVCQSIGDTESTAIEPYYPDLIKEYMFAYYTDEESLCDVMNEIWEHAAQEFSAFIQRCISDFPDQEFYQRAIQVYNANTTNKEALTGRMESLVTQNQQRSKDPRTLLRMLDGEQAFWRAVVIPEDDPEESIALLKLAGLETIAKEYGKWIISTPDIMVEAIEEMLSVPGGEAVQMMKQVLLAEHIRQLSISGFTRDAEYLREYMNSLLESDDSELADVYRIQTSNNEMMGWLIDFDNFYRAEQILRGMVKECNYESEEAVRLLIGSCVNLMRFAVMNNRNRYVKKGFELAQQAAAQRPEDEAVRIQLITCRTLDLYQKYVHSHEIGVKDLSAEQAAMEAELESFAFTGGEERDQALSVAWFEVQILCIEYLQPDEAKLRAIITKAEEILKISPKSEDVAKAAVLATLRLHQRVLHDKVTSEEVETLFAHLEQNADSETLRDAFFQMLSASEEAAHRKNYMTEAVMSGAITDARFNRMSGSGIPEIENRLDLLSQLDSLLPREPYRREGKKIGRNEPCPCGSGEKFKNCCQGKGVYD